MSSDEAAIRDVVANWLTASKAGDTTALADLLDEDVIFLQPGQPPMEGRQTFLDQFEANKGKFKLVEGTSDILEVHVAGEFAYMISKLRVVVQPPGSEPVTRKGHTLTIFKKDFQGRWVLARDANLLTVESSPPK
jgi:uncharacterized protein (TIGR02246 family)